MSSDKSKPRKSGSRADPSWRVKRGDTVPAKRYSRSDLLSLYQNTESPVWIGDPQHASEVILDAPCPPLFCGDAEFAHALGDDINARERPPAKVPDWFSEPNPERKPVTTRTEPPHDIERRAPLEQDSSPPANSAPAKPSEAVHRPLKVVIDKSAVIRNLPKDWASLNFTVEVKEAPQGAPQSREDLFAEEFSLIDREMDKKLRPQDDEEEKLPEWAAEVPQVAKLPSMPQVTPTPVQTAEKSPVATSPHSSPIPEFDSRAPKFHIDLLQEQIKANDPFAKLIFQKGVPDSRGFMCCIPLSLPLEKAWYYKDPQGQVQGPFSSIDMYNWNLVGYFSQTLQVAWRTAVVFVSLAELQKAPSEFWGRESDLAQVLKPTVPLRREDSKGESVSKTAKHTLEIDPNQAIRTLLGLDQKAPQKPEGARR